MCGLPCCVAGTGTGRHAAGLFPVNVPPDTDTYKTLTSMKEMQHAKLFMDVCWDAFDLAPSRSATCALCTGDVPAPHHCRQCTDTYGTAFGVCQSCKDGNVHTQQNFFRTHAIVAFETA